MTLTKNVKFLLIVFLTFIAGVFIGYAFSNNKVTDSKKISVNVNNEANNNSPGININKGKIGLTAEEALNIAYPGARTWSEDSYLSEAELASGQFDNSGLSSGWKIIFYSKTKNGLYEILIKDGESRGGKEKAAVKSTQTFKGNLVDSPVLAKSFFGLYPINTEIIGLKMYYDTGSKKFLWTIFFPKGSYTIDAEL